jgi:hypothetical protein
MTNTELRMIDSDISVRLLTIQLALSGSFEDSHTGDFDFQPAPDSARQVRNIFCLEAIGGCGLFLEVARTAVYLLIYMFANSLVSRGSI